MKWLTIEWIKAHSRIEYDCEDDLLELYGEAAEETVAELTRRSYDDFLSEFGEMPKAVVQASLMLVDVSYSQRSPVGVQQLHAVPYTFDLLIKPYMRLDG